MKTEVIEITKATKVEDTIMGLSERVASFLYQKMNCHGDVVPSNYMDTVERAFADYLFGVKSFHSKTKSLLYRDEEKELMEFFVPMDLKLKDVVSSRKEQPEIRDSTKILQIPSDNLQKILKQGSRILILGAAGWGKTVLLKYYCVHSVDLGYKIPVYMPLRWFNNVFKEDSSMAKMVYEYLIDRYGFEVDYQSFLYSLEGDNYIFLLDGYDEIRFDALSLARIKILEFVTMYSNNHYIMSSRVLDKDCFDDYTIYELCSFTKMQTMNFIMRLDFDYVCKHRFVKLLEESLYNEYHMFVTSPLTLSILFLTFLENENDGQIEVPLLLERVFDTLLYRHNNMKNGYESNLCSSLSFFDFKLIYLQFCFKSYFKGESVFSEAQLINILMECSKHLQISFDAYAYKDDLVRAFLLIQERQNYFFTHRIFQEYFAAYYVSRMPDEHQKKFCCKLIDYETDINMKKPFLDMLQTIEPARFDDVVIMPIIEKIWSTYTDSNEDLVKTIMRYIAMSDDFVYTEPLHSYRVYFIPSNGDVNRMSFQEYDILSYYRHNWIDYKEGRYSKRILEFIKMNEERLDAELLVSNDYAKHNYTLVKEITVRRYEDLRFSIYFELVSEFLADIKKYRDLDALRIKTRDCYTMLF